MFKTGYIKLIKYKSQNVYELKIITNGTDIDLYEMRFQLSATPSSYNISRQVVLHIHPAPSNILCHQPYTTQMYTGQHGSEALRVTK